MKSKTKRGKRSYARITVVISCAFIIKIVFDGIYKNASLGITGELSLQFLLSSTVVTILGFILYLYMQFKIENKHTFLSCIYNPRFHCCLLSEVSLKNYFDDRSDLLNDVELARIERNVETKEIWLLSPDFSAEEGDNVFREVVRARLDEGVHYSFIALNSPVSQERAKKIKDRYGSIRTNKRMHFYLIDGNEYSLFLSLYSLVIYNPSSFDDTQAYVCVGETEGCETSIYARLNEYHTQTATSITRELIKGTLEFRP